MNRRRCRMFCAGMCAAAALTVAAVDQNQSGCPFAENDPTTCPNYGKQAGPGRGTGRKDGHGRGQGLGRGAQDGSGQGTGLQKGRRGRGAGAGRGQGSRRRWRGGLQQQKSVNTVAEQGASSNNQVLDGRRGGRGRGQNQPA